MSAGFTVEHHRTHIPFGQGRRDGGELNRPIQTFAGPEARLPATFAGVDSVAVVLQSDQPAGPARWLLGEDWLRGEDEACRGAAGARTRGPGGHQLTCKNEEDRWVARAGFNVTQGGPETLRDPSRR